MLSVFSFVLLSFNVAAVPDTCIQDPQRSLECPRLIYKMATLPDKESGQNSRQFVCICLTDFEDLLIEPDNEVDKQLKKMQIQSWTAQLGISEEQLRELVKY
jgi:hypothetical protein